MPKDEARHEILRMTSTIVSSYVTHNKLETDDLPELIRSVGETLAGSPQRQPSRQKPAVPIDESLGEDYLICLEDGQKLKMLTRHLRLAYGMSPNDYREKWGLSANYPMVAPGYSSFRSKLAKSIGLGTNRTRRPERRRRSTN